MIVILAINRTLVTYSRPAPSFSMMINRIGLLALYCNSKKGQRLSGRDTARGF